MRTWSLADVDEQPEITLRGWRVYETERGEHHLVGHCVENEYGRVSSAIASFDAKVGAGITRSGRRYVLSGEPGFNQDALHVWGIWAARFGVTDAKDVSDEYYAHTNEGASRKRRRGSWATKVLAGAFCLLGCGPQDDWAAHAFFLNKRSRDRSNSPVPTLHVDSLRGL